MPCHSSCLTLIIVCSSHSGGTHSSLERRNTNTFNRVGRIAEGRAYEGRKRSSQLCLLSSYPSSACYGLTLFGLGQPSLNQLSWPIPFPLFQLKQSLDFSPPQIIVLKLRRKLRRNIQKHRSRWIYRVTDFFICQRFLGNQLPSPHWHSPWKRPDPLCKINTFPKGMGPCLMEIVLSLYPGPPLQPRSWD